MRFQKFDHKDLAANSNRAGTLRRSPGRSQVDETRPRAMNPAFPLAALSSDRPILSFPKPFFSEAFLCSILSLPNNEASQRCINDDKIGSYAVAPRQRVSRLACFDGAFSADCRRIFGQKEGRAALPLQDGHTVNATRAFDTKRKAPFFHVPSAWIGVLSR
jgi:hypothetical protein